MKIIDFSTILLQFIDDILPQLSRYTREDLESCISWMQEYECDLNIISKDPPQYTVFRQEVRGYNKEQMKLIINIHLSPNNRLLVLISIHLNCTIHNFFSFIIIETRKREIEINIIRFTALYLCMAYIFVHHFVNYELQITIYKNTNYFYTKTK